MPHPRPPILLVATMCAVTTISQARAEETGVFPYMIHEAVLDNGLRVVVVPMPTPGVVAYHTWMSVGSRDEVDPGRTGFAHFFEHLMFYGSEELDREEHERIVQRMGAAENAWTWHDDTVYHTVANKDALPEIVRIESDRFMNLHLEDDDVRREAGAVRGEFLKGRASPGNLLSEELYATAFTTHTYGHSTIGYEADILAMPTSLDYARTFYDRYYRPENTTIHVSGDVDPEASLDLIRTAYGGWERAAEPPPEVPVEPLQEAMRTAELTWPSPTAPRVAYGWRLSGESQDESGAALQIIEELLFAPVGPLTRRIVEEEDLAYYVHGGRDSTVDPGLFTITVMAKDAGHFDAIDTILREEIDNLRTDGPDIDRLTATRSHSRYSLLLDLADPARVNSTLGWQTRRGGDAGAFDRFFAKYLAVTPEDVQRVAAQTFIDDQLTRVTLTSAPQEEAP